MLRSTFAGLAVLAVLCLVPALASGRSAVGDQYCDPLAPNACFHKTGGKGHGGPNGAGGGANGASAAGGANGQGGRISEAEAARRGLRTALPATGVPVLAIVGFGVMLLSSGLALRQLSHDGIR